MYTSYGRNSAVFICFMISSLCLVECEVLRKNCSNYHQVYKENLRNCLVNVTQGNFSLAVETPTKNLPKIKDIKEEDKQETYEGHNESSAIAYSNDSDFEQENTNNHNETKWEIGITDDMEFMIHQLNDSVSLEIRRTSVEARKKKLKMNDVIPYLIIPGFIMAGVLPWLIPGLKLTVMAVAMVNQMAFTSSLFSLIRGYIFDTSQEEHVLYVNHGYNKYKYQKNPHVHR